MIEMTGWTPEVIGDQSLDFLVSLVNPEPAKASSFEGRPFVRSFEEAIKKGWLPANGRR